MTTITLAVHGGAGTPSPDNPERFGKARATMAQALRRGQKLLLDGGSALEAVEAAVIVLEDSGVFNAGRGAAATSAGRYECDAAIMDGHSRAAGAVASVCRIRNPISAARLVMQQSKHVLLVGTGAEQFAHGLGAAAIEQDYFTNRAAVSSDPRHGTVGAVALDSHGQLAAATSTGGTYSKLPGRVGDSPIIGAGTFADARCAVSATGVGEYFIRTVFAHRLAMLFEYSGLDFAASAESALKEVVALGGEGGAIAVSNEGEVTLPYAAQAMFRGWVSGNGAPVVGITREMDEVRE